MYHTSVIVQVIPTHHFHDNVTSWAAPAHLTDTVPSVLIKSTPAISITETWAAIYWRKKEKVKKETIVEEFFSLPVKLQLFNDILQSLLPQKKKAIQLLCMTFTLLAEYGKIPVLIPTYTCPGIICHWGVRIFLVCNFLCTGKSE